MSANLLAGVEPTFPTSSHVSMNDGVITTTADNSWYSVARWIISLASLTEDKTMHASVSLKWHGAAATTGDARGTILYYDAAGKLNGINVTINGITTEWRRFEITAVIPSGMRPAGFQLVSNKLDAAYDATHPCLSYESPVTLAAAAHTPYATQDHLRSEYATKAALKVTSDAVTAEVTERGKLAGRVGTLESTSGTHASKLEQLATSIKSLVKGESTYTDPDGKSATSGIYSLVTQTRDSVTALFGQYTKTADLASTQAVKDAKKAGTDAQAAASAAQTTADSAKSTASAAQSTANTAKTNAATAQSTANAAKGTADSLATMIREDATGITVGKSADGKTWSTGRTRMTDKAFQVLDKAGATVAQLAADGVSLLSGLVKLQARKEGPNNIAIMSSDFLGLNSLWQAVMRAGKETGGAYVEGYAAAIAEVTGKRGTARLYCTGGDGSTITANNAFTVTPDGYDLSQPEYLAAALLGTGGGGTGVTHSQDAVAMAHDLDTCGPGVFSYNESTAGTPTSWGTCVCIRAGDGTTSTWLFEFALPTVGDPLWRRNINGGGWTSWWTITSQ